MVLRESLGMVGPGTTIKAIFDLRIKLQGQFAGAAGTNLKIEC